MSHSTDLSKLPKGYRVHFDRLRSINKTGDFVKTHKYKLDLSKYNQEELWDKFSQVGKVVDSSKEGSLLYFIFQLVNLGFIFVQKPAYIPQKKKLLSINVVDPIEDLINENNLPIVDSKAFLVFLKQSASKSKTADSELKNIFETGLSLFYLGYKEKLENIDNLTNKDLKEVFALFKERRELTGGKITSQDRIQIFSQYYEVNLSGILDKIVDTKETFIVQHLPISELIKQRSYQEIILERIFPTAERMGIQTTGEAITMEVLGAPNGWSRLLGTTIYEFQKGRERVKDILVDSDPEYFSSHIQELEFLSEKIYIEAQKIPKENVEFISHNWSKYRNLLQGRVQGWLSNFINRIREYPNVIEKNQEILSLLQHSDKERDIVFQGLLGDDYKLRISEIEELGSDIHEMSQQGIYNESFSRLIEQYNYLTQDIAERIEKYTREPILEIEGIENPKTALKNLSKIDKETGSLVLKIIIPKLLPKYPRFIGESKQDISQQLEDSMESLKVVFEESKKFFYTLQNQTKPLESYDEELLRKRVQSLIKFYQRSHPAFQKELKNILDNLIDDNVFSEIISGSKVVYQSRFVRRKKDIVNLKPEVTLEVLCNSLKDYLDFEKSSFEEFFHLSEVGIPDWIPSKISLLKMYWSLDLKDLNEVVIFDLDDEFVWLKKSRVARFFTYRISKSIALRLLQSGYGSEISGQSSFLSKKSYVERIVIQNMGSNDKGQSYLEYVPFEFGEMSIFSKEIEEFNLLKGRSDLSDDQRERRTFLKKLLKRNKKRIVKKGLRKEFSKDIQSYIDKNHSSISNIEIAKEIWSQGKHNLIDLEKEILRQIPHRWMIVNESKVKFQDGSIVDSESLILNKKAEAVTWTGKLYGYQFPLLTSGHQLQFFDKFLAQGFDHQVEMLGTSLIFERENIIVWNDINPRIKTISNSYQLYLAIPWKFSNGKKGSVKELISYNNYLGIDLGEYGIGWAVLDKKNAQCIESGFIEFPLLKSLRDEADSWKLKQATGTFSTATTRIARIRENATGQIRNLIHSLSLEHDAVPVYEKEVDAFETGGNKIKKLYRSLKTSDVYGETEADNMVKKKIWGTQFGMIGSEVSAYLTSQTCRHCGRCATHEVYSLVDNNRSGKLTITSNIIEGSNIVCVLPDDEYNVREVWKTVKYSQRRSTNTGKGGQDEFVCQYSDCGYVCNADEQAAKNIALKKFAYENKGKTKEDYLDISLEYAERNS